VNLQKEDGQVLVLALAFMAFAALVIAATLHFAFASSATAATLKSQRNTTYAADGATDAAIQVARADSTVGAFGDARCQSTVPSSYPASAPTMLTSTLNGLAVKVICTYSSDPLQPDRTVTFTTFTTFTSVAAPVVQAQVIYHDSPANGAPSVFVSKWSYCARSASC